MVNFRARLGAAMALLLGGCAAFIQLYFPSSFRAQADLAFTDRAQGLARLTGSSLGPALDFDDRPAAARRLAELSSVSDTVAAVLYDRDREPFARWSREGSTTVALEPTPPPEGFTLARDLYVARHPIVARGVEGGELVVQLSTRALVEQEQRARRAVWLASLGVLGLGLLATLLLGRVLLRPIARVTNAARRISAGDVDAGAELQLDRTDEVGVMAKALHDMVGRLVEQRALLESQSESSSEGILVADASGRLLAHNRRFRELWGVEGEQISTLSLAKVLGTLRTHLAQPLPLLDRADDFTKAESAPFELKDGRVLTAYRAPISDRAGQTFAIAWYFRDVTALATAQEQLVLADRRSSVGQLAAGVAHEVNNPLSFILGNLQFCLEEVEKLKLPADQTAMFNEALNDCTTGAQRVAYIVRSLTALSRGDDGERASVDLIECLKSTLTIAAPELKHRARVITNFALEKPIVDANAVRLGQVFLNLLINAAKSLPDRPENLIEVAVSPGPEHTVEIAITDTGSGMSDAVKAKLFQPFFTTRAVGSGTGLGLSISLSIVQSYGGTIKVDSTLGKGSTFTVRLPLSTRAAAAAPQKSKAVPVPARKLKLMVVDDEPQVAAAVRRSVSSSHDVTVFQRAEDALASLNRGDRFDALLTDLHMPGMTGPELYLKVLKLDPALASRTLFMSGGAVTDEVRRFVAENPNRLFAKPFDAQELRRALADLSREGAH